MGKRKGPKKASPPKNPLGVQVTESKVPDSSSSKDSQNSKEASASFTTASVSSLQDPISEPAAGSKNTNIVAASPMSTEASSDSQTPKEDAPPLITASASKLQDPPLEPTTGSGKNNTVDAVNSEKVILMTNPEEFQTCDGKEEDTIGVNGPRALRVPLHATVSEATRDGLWLLPAPRSDVVVSLHAYLTTMNLLGWSSSDSTTSPRTLRSIAVQATIYHTWTERNNRVYRSQTLSASDLFQKHNLCS
ncbi:hypothetical protein F2Q70_00044937 [Brassica cretica]|uniref:Uncharacterized protein n=1 Tax=Brassica cretica TaxID=69181 RepID=A0A8S9KFX9_BRACR|nr:hypothetical protein F2Q70_00044937 [Brassica cretica]